MPRSAPSVARAAQPQVCTRLTSLRATPPPWRWVSAPLRTPGSLGRSAFVGLPSDVGLAGSASSRGCGGFLGLGPIGPPMWPVRAPRALADAVDSSGLGSPDPRPVPHVGRTDSRPHPPAPSPIGETAKNSPARAGTGRRGRAPRPCAPGGQRGWRRGPGGCPRRARCAGRPPRQTPRARRPPRRAATVRSARRRGKGPAPPRPHCSPGDGLDRALAARRPVPGSRLKESRCLPPYRRPCTGPRPRRGRADRHRVAEEICPAAAAQRAGRGVRVFESSDARPGLEASGAFRLT